MSAEERAAEVAWLRYRDDYMRARALTKRQAASQMRKREFVAGFLADRANAERDERLRALIAAIDDLYPPYNYELRYDGSEDPAAAAYVDAFREVDAALAPFRAALAAADPEAQP